MKNLKKYKDAQVAKALPVPAGANAGDVVLLGTDGLKAVLKTARATAATIAAGTAAPGLVDGQATVILVGVGLIVELQIGDAVTQFQKVYKKTADGTYSGTATGATFIGYAMTTLAAAGKCDVAIAPA